MSAGRSYQVQADRKAGTVTYCCSTPQWALVKVRDFAKAGYTGTRVIGPDGERVTLSELELLVAGVAPPVPALVI